MALHILKMCVGIDDVAQLARVQARRMREMESRGEPPLLIHWTTMMPRRATEIEKGGSLYWIIKRAVRVRQRIIAIERVPRQGTRKNCAFQLDPALVLTVPQPRRPHQGWRYLEAHDAPADIGPFETGGEAELPPELAEELYELGLL